MHIIQPFPIEVGYIFYKTLEWTENVIDSFKDLETAMFIRDSELPYCTKTVNGLEDLSLSGVCGGEVGAVKNVAYYIKMVFPNVYDGSNWCFKLPADFDMGGVVLLDGSV